MAPPHYTNIRLRNFRGFRSPHDIPLAPLTFLVGPNSSGKSSICASILFLTQSNLFPRYASSFQPSWMGTLVDLGSFEDTIYGHRTNLSMSIELTTALDPRHDWRLRESPSLMSFEFEIKAGKDSPNGHFRCLKVTDQTSKEVLEVHVPSGGNRKFQIIIGRHRQQVRTQLLPRFGGPEWRIIAQGIRNYIQAHRREFRGRKAAWDRITNFLSSSALGIFSDRCHRVTSGRSGPQRWYEVAPRRRRTAWSQESVRSVFGSIDPEMVETTDMLRRGRSTPASVQGLNKVLEEIEIGRGIIATQKTPYHSFIYLTDNISKIRSNIADFGYGTSQVIPVISSCLSPVDGPLFVEQPEIHLHPKAQGTIAELLARTSLRRQVVVETHSPHIINRARIMVAKGELAAKDVVINYVDRGRAGCDVTPILLHSNGDFIGKWPEGFFDERYEDTMTLLEIKTRTTGGTGAGGN